LGRDLLSLIGLVAVMVWKAPFMAILAFMVMPPAVLAGLRAYGRARVPRLMYRSADSQGLPDDAPELG
jgi:hypothetical protein